MTSSPGQIALALVHGAHGGGNVVVHGCGVRSAQLGLSFVALVLEPSFFDDRDRMLVSVGFHVTGIEGHVEILPDALSLLPQGALLLAWRLLLEFARRSIDTTLQ